MIRLPPISKFALGLLLLPCALQGQPHPPAVNARTNQAPPPQEWVITNLTERGWVEYNYLTHLATATNGVLVKYGGAFLLADRVTADLESGEVIADGMVRIERDDQIWAGEHIRYNFNTRQMEATQFRTGRAPVFAGGNDLHTEATNQVYVATNAFVTTDDVAQPAVKVRARQITLIPGDKIIARDATLYVNGVPVFYFPYYSRSLTGAGNEFNFIPGYRSSFGPFLMSSYRFQVTDQLASTLHLDLRERRGVGLGPDLDYHLGRWGEGFLTYYYLYDVDPTAGGDPPVSNDRQRLYFSYLAMPATNLSVRSLVRYQSDPYIVQEFFESQYIENTQPSTFVEANKYWQNFSVDAYVQPRILNFLETVERLPDVRLTGYRQQLGATPFYYESVTSAGYYERLFAVTNGMPLGLDYAGARADTFHQVLLPQTFFGWLNVTPRVGGRFTSYSEATGPGAVTDQVNRGVFNTGAEASFSASRVWPEMHSELLEMDGLRHILEPAVNYVWVPTPNAVGTNVIPQFDYQLPSLRLLPIEYPDYNAIDSINSQNVMRFELRNKLQTKRDGQVVNLVNWDLYMDWHLRPLPGQTTFSDVYSDLVFRPRSWLMLESLTAYNLAIGTLDLSMNTVTFLAGSALSWSVNQYYLRNDISSGPTSLGLGNNLFSSTLFYRLNENWGLRAYHRFDAGSGQLQEQAYSIYRDLRSWTAALTFRVRENPGGPQDVGFGFTFSLKAFPRYGLGADVIQSAPLLGY